MMTLQEAISHARKVAKDRNETANLTPTEYEDYINSCRECAAEHDQLADWLTELQERREADRWIPVSERLPEVSDWYLVTRYDSRGYRITDMTSYNTSSKEFSRDVIAWKPLPKPYESEARNENNN